MQKCFYHAKTDAVTMCMGCKMPVCGACRDAGNKGFCDACMRKVSSLGDQIKDAKKTGMVQTNHKATMIKSASRPTGPKNVTFCFQHFEVVATGTCPTCNKAFCDECLDDSGTCVHCAKLAEAEKAPPPPARRPGAPTERPPALPPRPAARPTAEPAGGSSTSAAMFFVVALVAFAIIVAYKVMH